MLVCVPTSPDCCAPGTAGCNVNGPTNGTFCTPGSPACPITCTPNTRNCIWGYLGGHFDDEPRTQACR